MVLGGVLAAVLFAATTAFASPQYLLTDLRTLGGTESYAFSLNDSGQVVGKSYAAGDGTYHAFTYLPGGGILDLGTFGGTSPVASSISDSGQVVVSTWDASGMYRRAFIVTPGSGVQDLGTVVETPNQGTAINNSGQVVGASYFGGSTAHAFLYTPGAGVTDLGSWSVGTAINNDGNVVGAFLYTADGMIDLNSLLPLNSGWDLMNATDINDRGQIVGYGDINGKMHAFLLSPNFIPEPGTLPLLGLGLAGLALTRRRKH